MKVLVLLCLFGLVAFAVAGDITNCGKSGDDLQISSLVVTPDPPVPGQDVNVALSGSLSKTITGGKAEVKVYFIGIKIFDKTYDLCSFSAGSLKCPLEAGPVSINITEQFPKEIPPGTYKGTVTLTDQDSNEIACVAFDLHFASAGPVDELDEPVLNDEIIRKVNKMGAWKAGRNNKFEGRTRRWARTLLGARLRRKLGDVIAPRVDYKAANIPDSFDSRKQWPNCIHAIRNQEQCGSCWAFGATEALSDRFCIVTKGSTNVVLSPEDLVSCDTSDYGCSGGYLTNAWDYMQNSGVVSDDCFPYSAGGGVAPSCKISGGSCPSGATYKKYYVKSGSIVQPSSVSAIQTEIMNNGPVEAAFSVYQDFFSYKSGVYTHQYGGLDGGHAIKMLGWGVDSQSGKPYWICANSWGSDWADLNGYFWILRGSDECGIESNVVAGTPKA